MRLRGTLSYFSDRAWTSVRPGGAVFLPWGCLRTNRNDRDPDQQALGGDHTVGVRGSSRGVRTSSGGPGMERIVGIATEHRIEIQALPSA